MIPADSTEVARQEPASPGPAELRFASLGKDPAVLADVYRENINIAIWQRELSDALKDAVDSVTASNRALVLATTVSPRSVFSVVSQSLGTAGDCALSASVAELVEMFCCLLGLERAGLRLRVLNAAMCPKFHVDRVPCRLVTTYLGAGTEWLQHDAVDRSKLGAASLGQPDLQSGLLKTPCNIERLSCGDVAVLKGETWEGNENAGLVHRSPAVADGTVRLLLTLDVSE